MEPFSDLLNSKVPRLAGIVALGSTLVLIHSGLHLTNTLLKKKMNFRENLAHAAFPFFFLSRRVQPQANWKYIDRFLYSAVLIVVAMATLAIHGRLTAVPAL
jgi:hypothetical protein